MQKLEHLFAKNQAWAERIRQQDPDFFLTLSRQQFPSYLWIGCSDSRVPANQIIGLLPGEVFVHRNIANLVVHTDLNCLSVIQFAVDVLKVRHIMVVGHYGCGGVGAAYRRQRIGLSDNWLRHVEDVREKHEAELSKIEDIGAACDRLCELNVAEQVGNVCQTTIVRDAWERGQDLTVHGWVYGLQDGLLRDLNVSRSDTRQPLPSYPSALVALPPPAVPAVAAEKPTPAGGQRVGAATEGSVGVARASTGTDPIQSADGGARPASTATTSRPVSAAQGAGILEAETSGAGKSKPNSGAGRRRFR